MNQLIKKNFQNTLVKHQNELGDIQRTSNRMATSITQKITSDIKVCFPNLKLFVINNKIV